MPNYTPRGGWPPLARRAVYISLAYAWLVLFHGVSQPAELLEVGTQPLVRQLGGR